MFKKHPSATLLQLRHHIERKYRGTLAESQWDLVKAKLSELADTGETELSTSLKTLMDEAFQEKPDDATEEEVREILETKYGRMLPDRIFNDMVLPILFEMVEGIRESAFDVTTKKKLWNDSEDDDLSKRSPDLEAFDPSDEKSLEKLKSLPQSVKDIVDNYIVRPPKKGDSVVVTVMKKIKCKMPITSEN